MTRRISAARFLLLLVLAAAPAAGHNLELTDTLIVLKTDGTYQVDITCDLDALALGASPTADSAELAAALAALEPAELEARLARLRRTFERRVRVLFDGRRARPAISFPDWQTPIAVEAAVPTVLGLTARLEGRIPEGARELEFRASRAFPPVHLTVLDQASATGVRQLLELGGTSEAVPLGAPLTVPDERVSGPETAGRYLALGFWHIVPEGLDHILFVLGLFLLAARLGPLLWQVTAFTVAHAVTLTLATYGVVSLPSSVVEPLIALSIAWVAIENLFTSELKPWRPAVVFVFGLLHGLGFAGVLGELGLPAGEFLTALVSFNAGIELGQLAVLAAAFTACGWGRDRPWYRRRVTVPASALIAVAGLWWAVERTLM